MLLESIKISHNIATVVLANVHVWHGSVLLNFSWLSYPVHHVLRGVGELAGDVGLVGNVIKRRTDCSLRSSNSWDSVAGFTSVIENLVATYLWIASGKPRCGFLRAIGIAAATHQHDNRRNYQKNFHQTICTRRNQLLPSSTARFGSAEETRRSESRSHAANNASPAKMYIVPAGIHIMRPPSCWSSRGVSPHTAVVCS